MKNLQMAAANHMLQASAKRRKQKMTAVAKAAEPNKSLEKYQGASLFTQRQIDLIKRDICKGATDDELQKFLWECERTRLDPFSRQIYSIQRREKYLDGENWRWRTTRSTQVSIDGFRLTAQRSGEYAGQLGPEWCGPDGVWRDVWLDANPPAAARVAALRKDFEKPCWGVARFEAYAQKNKDGYVRMWATMGDVMIAKCAEALALRRAFPQELGGLYTSEEMMQAANPPPLQSSLAEELDDEIPEYGDAAARSVPGASPSAAASTPEASPQPGAAASLSLEDMAREAARHGPDTLRKFFNHRSSAEKKQLRAIESELIALYPPLT